MPQNQKSVVSSHPSSLCACSFRPAWYRSHLVQKAQNQGKKRGKLFYLQLELFCLQLSFFAYSPLRCMLDALSHCQANGGFLIQTPPSWFVCFCVLLGLPRSLGPRKIAKSIKLSKLEKRPTSHRDSDPRTTEIPRTKPKNSSPKPNPEFLKKRWKILLKKYFRALFSILW